MNFYEHCQNSGLHLLKDDIKHVRRIMPKLPYELHKRVLRDYIAIWVSAMQECTCVQQKQNTGRREANLYLLGVLNGKGKS